MQSHERLRAEAFHRFLHEQNELIRKTFFHLSIYLFSIENDDGIKRFLIYINFMYVGF